MTCRADRIHRLFVFMAERGETIMGVTQREEAHHAITSVEPLEIVEIAKQMKKMQSTEN